jgi:hypothetical protein
VDATSGTVPDDSGLDAMADATTADAAASFAAADVAVDAETGFCPGGRDVFRMTSLDGGFVAGSHPFTLTDIGAAFTATTDLLYFYAGDVQDSISLDFNAVDVPAPGVYPQGSARDGGLQLAGLGVNGTYCPPTSGTVTVVESAEDDAGVVLSAQIGFDLGIDCAGPNEEVQGCFRYVRDSYSVTAPPPAPDPSYDAGLAIPPDAGDVLTHCLAYPEAFYVEGAAGNPVVSSSAIITQQNGTWYGEGSPGVMQLYVDTQAARWDLAVIAPQGGALHAGLSATVGVAGAGLGISVNGVSCTVSAGDFTLFDYADNGATLPSLRRMTATFDATCQSGGPPMRGCVHFVGP